MENKYNKVYLRDALKDKTPAQILEMLPFMICIEEYYKECCERGTKIKEHWTRKSYDVIGVNKDSLIIGFKIRVETDEDDFSFGLYRYEESYSLVPLNKLDTLVKKDKDGNVYSTTEYIICKDCTPKQRNFLVKYCDYDEDDAVSGYEAYHIIKETCDEWKKQKEYRSKHPYDDIYDDPEPDDWDNYGYYDVPNM